jgi:predicted MPP superfamily phosphohydrolase
MKDIDIKLLELLKEGSATVEDMQKATNLNRVELAKKLNHLKSDGYIIKKLYASEGFYFSLDNNLNDNKIKEIILDDYLRFLVISDCHFGSIFDRLELIEYLYNYSIINGINNIFNTGDLVQGVYTEKENVKSKFTSIEDQISYVIKNYPYDKRIFNYILLGNHDYNSIKHNYFDISKQLESKRIDFSILGYEYAFIKTNNDYICLHHPFVYDQKKYDIDLEKIIMKEKINPVLILRGHTHESALYYNKDNILTLNIPCLCGTLRKEIGAWDISLYYENGYVTDTVLRPLIVEKETFPYTKVLTKR